MFILHDQLSARILYEVIMPVLNCVKYQKYQNNKKFMKNKYFRILRYLF